MRIPLLAAIVGLALPVSVAHAEVSPGNSDLGYKVYEILDAGGAMKMGMLVIAGNAAVPDQATAKFQAGTAYWFWTTPDAKGKYCYSGATATPFPAVSFQLQLKYDSTASGPDAGWAISSTGVVKGCKATSSEAKVVAQVALGQARTNFTPTQSGATAWWTVSSPGGSGAAWLAPHLGGGQDYGWAYTEPPGEGGACPQVSPPVFSGAAIVVTSVPSSALQAIPCAQTGVDFIPQ